MQKPCWWEELKRQAEAIKTRFVRCELPKRCHPCMSLRKTEWLLILLPELSQAAIALFCGCRHYSTFTQLLFTFILLTVPQFSQLPFFVVMWIDILFSCCLERKVKKWNMRRQEKTCLCENFYLEPSHVLKDTLLFFQQMPFLIVVTFRLVVTGSGHNGWWVRFKVNYRHQFPIVFHCWGLAWILLVRVVTKHFHLALSLSLAGCSGRTAMQSTGQSCRCLCTHTCTHTADPFFYTQGLTRRNALPFTGTIKPSLHCLLPSLVLLLSHTHTYIHTMTILVPWVLSWSVIVIRSWLHDLDRDNRSTTEGCYHILSLSNTHTG